jgi:valyl-tRNA synthetase
MADALLRFSVMDQAQRGVLPGIAHVPGLDHAGIATQSMLVRKGVTKVSEGLGLGVDADTLDAAAPSSAGSRILRQHASSILSSLQHLGLSFAPTPYYFTLNRFHSRAVDAAFVRLAKQQVLHRKRALVSWCGWLGSVISDLEVDQVAVEGPQELRLPHGHTAHVGELHRVAYRLSDDSDDVLVDTTRPETIFADVALAVHSSHPLAGTSLTATNPLTGAALPFVVDDDLVDPAFGTGVVKVTPAHDAADFACGERHSLPLVSMMDEQNRGVGSVVGDKYAGMDRHLMRPAVVAELVDLGAYRGAQPHATSIDVCSRSGDLIEPRPLHQWFVDSSSLAQRVLALPPSESMDILPARGARDFDDWLRRSGDWCISRQLWWGHRIPAYKVVVVEGEEETESESVTDGPWVIEETPEAAAEAARALVGPSVPFRLEQDKDVLDTWFSSGIVPLSVNGWPDRPSSLESTVYPFDLLVTGGDILYFWVARMAMMATALGGEDGAACPAPFRRVVLHPMLRDEEGRKMSKSLGNVILPEDVMHGRSLADLQARLAESVLSPDEIARSQEGLARSLPKGIPAVGCDGLRWALALHACPDKQDTRFSVKDALEGDATLRKTWNAVRFALSRVSGDASTEWHSALSTTLPPLSVAESLPPLQRFILQGLADFEARVTDAMARADVAAATRACGRALRSLITDVLIEDCKVRSRLSPASDATSNRVLMHALTTWLRCAHPIAPTTTQHLFEVIVAQATPGAAVPPLVHAAAGEDRERLPVDAAIAHAGQVCLDAGRGLRALAQTGRAASEPAPAVFVSLPDTLDATAAAAVSAYLETEWETVQALAGGVPASLHMAASADRPALPYDQESIVSPSVTIYFVPAPVDRSPERMAALARQAAKVERELTQLQTRMAAANYVDRAPEKVRAQHRERADTLAAKLDELRRDLA